MNDKYVRHYDKFVPLYVMYNSPVDETGIFCPEAFAILCMKDSALLNELVHYVQQYADDAEYDGLLNVKKTLLTSVGRMQIWRENAGYVVTMAS